MLKILITYLSKQRISTIFIGATFLLIIFSIITIFSKRIHEEEEERLNTIRTTRYHCLNLENSLSNITPTNFNREVLVEKTDSLNFSLDVILNTQFKKNDKRRKTNSTKNKQEEIKNYLVIMTESLNNNLNNIIYKEIVKDSFVTVTKKSFLYNSGGKETTFIETNEKQQRISPLHKTHIRNAILQLNRIDAQLYNIQKITEESFNSIYNKFIYTLIFIFILSLFILFLLYSIVQLNYTKPIEYLNKHATLISSGDYTKIKAHDFTLMEEIPIAMNHLVFEIDNAIKYINDFSINSIEQLNKKHDTFLNNNYPLALSLKKMSKNLNEVATKEQNRNWVINGLAKFNNLLNKASGDIHHNFDVIIKELVEYSGALQGALFISKIDSKGKYTLILESVYAYDRNKNIEKQIKAGEGLVGQCWREKKYIVLDEIPEDHSSIKSGLGQAKPRALILYPILDNEKVYGVIELASFTKFEPFVIEFIKNVTESLATSLASAEINLKTQLLLQESQELTLIMKEQEEELKQNVEELQATQEEIEKRELIKENQIRSLKQIITEKDSQFKVEKTQLIEKIKNAENEISKVSLDNDTIRQLKQQFEDERTKAQQEILNLQETIKIKDLRIDKLRKKLQDARTDD